MGRWKRLAVLAVCMGVAVALQVQTTLLTPSSLEGTWKLRSLSLDGKDTPATGYMIFHGNHYAFITNMERPKLTAEISRKTVGRLSEAEKDLYVEAFRSLTAAAGSYTLEGDQIVYLMEVVRSPHLAGAQEKRKSWFEGTRLVQDFEGGGRPRIMIWERVSSPPAQKQ